MKTVVCLLLSLLALPAQADLYRYRDADGRVIFGNTPPANARELQRIPYTPSPAKPIPPKAPDRPAATPAAPASAPQPDPALATQRQALLGELLRQQEALRAAQQALKEGEDVRLGSERNYQRYLDRVQGLRDTVTRHEQNIELITREINSLSPLTGVR